MKMMVGFCEYCSTDDDNVRTYVKSIVPLPNFNLQVNGFCPQCNRDMKQVMPIVEILKMCEENQESINKEYNREVKVVQEKDA